MRKHALGHRALYLASVLLVLTGIGCGQPYAKKKSNLKGSSVVTATDYDAAVLQGGSSGASAGGQAPAKVKIQGTGYSGQYSVKVPVGRVLKVAFTPGKQASTASDGKFYPYSVLSVYIGVGNNIQPTSLLYNGYGGGNAEQSQVIDLSDAFNNTCGSDPNCRQDVVVTVSRAQSDDGCYSVPNQICAAGYTHVPEGHPWTGTLFIQNDDTSAL